MFCLRVTVDRTPESVLHRLLAGVADVRQRLDSRVKVEPAEFAQIMKLHEDTHHCGTVLIYSQILRENERLLIWHYRLLA